MIKNTSSSLKIPCDVILEVAICSIAANSSPLHYIKEYKSVYHEYQVDTRILDFPVYNTNGTGSLHCKNDLVNITNFCHRYHQKW